MALLTYLAAAATSALCAVGQDAPYSEATSETARLLDSIGVATCSRNLPHAPHEPLARFSTPAMIIRLPFRRLQRVRGSRLGAPWRSNDRLLILVNLALPRPILLGWTRRRTRIGTSARSTSVRGW
jgi:hypothetical protein